MAPSDPPYPDAYWQGIDQFNRGDFYACHDTLEAIWIEAFDPDKTFYQGILQVAVGIYHLSNLNWRGAAILLGEGIGRLRKAPADDTGCYGGIDRDRLMADAQALLLALQTHGEAQVAPLAIALGLRSNADAPSIDLQAPPLPKIAIVTPPGPL